jgi:hypothetical protein
MGEAELGFIGFLIVISGYWKRQGLRAPWLEKENKTIRHNSLLYTTYILALSPYTN